MADPGAPKVLVVDDDRMVLLSTRLVLESAGFRVAISDRGDRAVEAVREERPDVLLLDLMMPGVDGWETLRRLRADPVGSLLPVIVFTASENTRGRIVARTRGADDYVQKPFDADRLVALVRRHVPSAGVPVPATPAR
jgi:DNA-binding response OmpR family regulator